MKKALILGALLTGLTGLAGCSSDSDDDEKEVLEEIITNTLLNGTWIKACQIDSAMTSFTVTLTFNDGSATLGSTEYGDTTCTLMSMINPTENFTYTLGDNITVDGSVAGITTAIEINIVNSGVPSFDIIAIDDDLISLYLGDDNSPATDSSTAEKRPVQLEDVPPFIKQ